ncbi:MAG TPA: hypothetical protein VGI88_00770 [Verrucomicrobiae bacterium]
MSFIGLTAQPALAREVTLEDNSLLVAFDSHSGALTRMEDKIEHWTIERRPNLGISFRLFAPLPDRRWNPVLGQKQRAVEVKKLSPQQIHLKWENLASESDGVIPLALTADVTLTNGVLRFAATLANNSPLTVETIDYPYFGDFNPPSRSTTNMVARTMRRGNPGDLISEEIYPHFANAKGYWGVFWPTKNLESDQSPFCLIQAPNEGLYVQVDAAGQPYRLQYIFEQHPGVVSSITQLVPQEDEIGGKPVHLEFRACHFVFAPPHSTTTLAPIVLRCYQGDWHAGAELYKQWRSTLANQPSK